MIRIIKILFLYVIISFLISCSSNKKDFKKEDSVISYDSNCYDVDCFIDKLVIEDYFSREYLNYFFSKVSFKSGIIDIMDRPSTFVPWYRFKNNTFSSKIIIDGVKFYRNHEEVLKEVYNEYRVSPYIIVSTLGIETNYGRYQGNFNVADSLYTLSFYYPRRSKYFQQELREYLLMVERNHFDPFYFKGSYAGAMGYPQFMPSSFNKYAISYNKLDFPDIWNNVDDAIVSIANYYHNQGWVDGSLVMVEVRLDFGSDLDLIDKIIDESVSLRHSVGELRGLGVIPLEDVDDKEGAILFKLEVSPDNYKYYIGLNNFYVIWKYNHSKNYISAVYNIAKQIEYENYNMNKSKK